MDKIYEEMNVVLKGYYGLIDDLSENPEWVRKVEEDLG